MRALLRVDRDTARPHRPTFFGMGAATATERRRQQRWRASGSRLTARLPSGMVGRAVLAVVLAFGFWAWVTNNNDPDRRRDFDECPRHENQSAGWSRRHGVQPDRRRRFRSGGHGILSLHSGLTGGQLRGGRRSEGSETGCTTAPIHVQSTEKIRKKSARPQYARVCGSSRASIRRCP